MPGKFEAPRHRGKHRSPAAVIVPALLVMFAAAFFVSRLFGGGGTPPETIATAVLTEPTETRVSTQPAGTSQPEAPQVTARATIGAQGDLLMHKPVLNTCLQSDGSYDFSSLFRYAAEYVSAFDYAVANLETTLGGDAFPYRGNPSFNCPDAIVDSVAAAGYDMLLTANNHSYDTLMTGLNRTLEQVRGRGLDTLGTRLSEDEKRYSLVEVNGIQIGMVCYTYTMSTDAGGRPSLNNNSGVEKPEQINYFSLNNLNRFYSQMEQITAAMESDGAEATVLFLHWGTEYETAENATQRSIAQKMCDLGFDVIVGGHPHVVQPMELLESTVDPAHKTVCIYSLGNAVSNQRRELMNLKTGHTEDGVLFSFTFEKNSAGSVYVAGVEVLPTWVVMYGDTDNPTRYHILPLDDERREDWQSLYELSDEDLARAEASYDRTMAIVGAGLEMCRAYLEQVRGQG